MRPDDKVEGFGSVWSKLVSWFSSVDGVITTASIEEAIKPELTEIQEIQEQVYTVADHVEKMYWKFQEIDTRTNKMEKVIDFLASKHDDFDLEQLTDKNS